MIFKTLCMIVKANGGSVTIEAKQSDGEFVPLPDSPFTADEAFLSYRAF